MAVVILLLLVFGGCMGVNPSVNVGIKQTQLDLITHKIVDIINKNYTLIKLPDYINDFAFFHLRAWHNILRLQPLKAPQLQVVLLNKSTELELRGSDLALEVASDIETNVGFIEHRCKGIVTLQRGNFVIHGTLLTTNTNHLAFNVTTVSIAVNAQDIRLRFMDSFWDSIITVVAEFTKLLLFEPAKALLIPRLPPILTSLANQVLSELPDDIEVFKGASMKFTFPEAFAITEGWLLGSLSLYVHRSNHSEPPTYDPPPMPKYNKTCLREVQMFLSDYVLRSALDTAQELGKFHFVDSWKTAGLKVALDCQTPQTPKVTFAGQIGLNATAVCNAKIETSELFPPMEVGFTANLTGQLQEWIANSKLYFNVSTIAVSDLQIRSEFAIDANLLKKMLNSLILTIKNKVNKQVLAEGIQLPMFDLFEITNAQQDVVGQYLMICATLVPRGYPQEIPSLVHTD